MGFSQYKLLKWVLCCEQDDDTCEEWERHEALYEDVTNQGRCEERLFEEKIELKWEKGGSGLVFYTDAQYWKEEQGGVFHALHWICVHVSNLLQF